MMDFDATSPFPRVMWDEKSVYPKKESGFCFKPYMNDVFIEAFNNQTFNQKEKKSEILNMKFDNPPARSYTSTSPIEKKNIEVNRMRKMDIL